MNGTIERWLRGTMVALAATLAFASVGCIAEQGDPDSDESEAFDLDDEDVDSAEQPLDPAAGDSAASPGSKKEGGIALPGSDVMVGEEGTDPQPQPWRSAATDDEDDSNPSPSPAPDPFAPIVLSAPAGGHHLD